MANTPKALLNAKRIWAVNSIVGGHTRWPEFQRWGTENGPTLVYDWHDIGAFGRAPLEDIIAAVSRTQLYKSREAVQDRAEDIYCFSRVRIGDIILERTTKKIMSRVGVVRRTIPKDKSESYVGIFIEWFDGYFGEISSDFEFNPKREIQKITRKDKRFRQNFEKYGGIEHFDWRKDAIVFDERQIGVASGMFDYSRIEMYQTDSNANIEIINDKIKLQNSILDMEIGGVMSLFYGTNRKETVSSDMNEKYGYEEGDLIYGTCNISIPPDHVPGKLERPEGWWIFKRKENNDKDIVLLEAKPLAESEFYKMGLVA